jgi:PMR5 N terminal Domain
MCFLGERQSNPLEGTEEEHKVMFDPKRCSVTDGKWVFNESKYLPYDDTTCPYIDKQVSCARNGRPDKEYLYWEWKLDNCTLPRLISCIKPFNLLILRLRSIR